MISFKRRLQITVRSYDFLAIIVTFSLAFLFLQQRQEDLDIDRESAKLTDVPASTNYISKALRKIQYGVKEKCDPVFNIMYMKTHKCASSTMQNILFRYACTHNKKHKLVPCGLHPNNERKEEEEQKKYFPLIIDESNNVGGRESNHSDFHKGPEEEDPIIVAVPPGGVYAGSPERFKAEMLQHPEWLLPPSGVVNMFGLHTRLDPYQLQRILNPGSLWVTVLRNPVDLYMSSFIYFKVNTAVGSSLKEFLEKPIGVMKEAKRRDGKFGANQMTFDLGYGSNVFYEDDEINEMIAELEETFDLILISDRLDESLVLLGHALCWSLDDLVSLSKNVRSERVSITPEEKTKLEELNYSDMRLYQHFSRQFKTIVQLYGEEKLKEEVEELRAKKIQAEKYCVKEVVKGHHPNASIKEYSGDVLGFLLSRPDDPFCKALAWNSKHYINYFRESMKRRFQKLPRH